MSKKAIMMSMGYLYDPGIWGVATEKLQGFLEMGQPDRSEKLENLCLLFPGHGFG